MNKLATIAFWMLCGLLFGLGIGSQAFPRVKIVKEACEPDTLLKICETDCYTGEPYCEIFPVAEAVNDE